MAENFYRPRLIDDTVDKYIKAFGAQNGVVRPGHQGITAIVKYLSEAQKVTFKTAGLQKCPRQRFCRGMCLD